MLGVISPILVGMAEKPKQSILIDYNGPRPELIIIIITSHLFYESKVIPVKVYSGGAPSITVSRTVRSRSIASA